MFARLLGARRAEQMVALNAQIPQTHSLFVLLGEGRARAFMDHAVNRLAHRAAAASGLVARTDTSSLTVLFEHAALTPQAQARADTPRSMEAFKPMDLGVPYGTVSMTDLVGHYLEHPPKAAAAGAVSQQPSHIGGC